MDKSFSPRRRQVLKAMAVSSVFAPILLDGIIRNSFAQDMTGMTDMPQTSGKPVATKNAGIFTRPLFIPSVLAGTLLPSGVRHYRLRMATGEHDLLAGVRTATWGYNGSYLGPTIRIARQEPVHIHLENALDQSTTTHWHGAHVSGDMDGGPQLLIDPGDHYDYHFALEQPAATLWYHPHPNTRAGPHVYGGLAGLLLVDDGVDEELGLPHTYGVDDIPVIIQDRRFHPNGQLAYMTRAGDVMGMKGDHILVNGREQPYCSVPAQWVRFRILNASNARVYNLEFNDRRDFYVVASDAGFLAAPVSTKQFLIAPAERIEILVNLTHDLGRNMVLQSNSRAVVPLLSSNPMDSDALDHSAFDLLQLRVGAATGRPGRLPDKLVEIPRLQADGTHRRFTLQNMVAGAMAMPAVLRNGPGGMSMGIGGKKLFSINHEFMDMHTINFPIRRGSTEIWEVINQSHMAHPFHYHSTSFQILSRNGVPPPDYERGWKDTVLVRRGEHLRLVAPFHQPAGIHHPYMYHCHILEHEDNGMMGQFTVS